MTGRRVVITGMGAITPLGNDADSTWRGLREGRSGVGPLTLFDASEFPVRIAGQVRDFDADTAIPADHRPGRFTRAGRFGVAAGLEAMRHAGVGPGTYEPDACGVSLGASVGRPDLQLLVDIGHLRQESGRPDAFLTQSPLQVLMDNQNLPLSALARALDARGPAIGVSTACAGSAHALGEAFRCIQEGDATLMLAGGQDSLTSWCDMLGFSLLGAMTDRYNDDPEHASRPFDDDRSGFVVGEGGVVFVLEEREAALARGRPCWPNCSVTPARSTPGGSPTRRPTDPAPTGPWKEPSRSPASARTASTTWWPTARAHRATTSPRPSR